MVFFLDLGWFKIIKAHLILNHIGEQYWKEKQTKNFLSWSKLLISSINIYSGFKIL